MESDRELIFSRIQKALQALNEGDRTPYPKWDDALSVSIHAPGSSEPELNWQRFCERTRAVNGTPLDELTDLPPFLQEADATFGYCDPALANIVQPQFEAAGIGFETTLQRERVDDYLFGITRATGAIAETGSVIFDDLRTSSRLAALAPWIHVTLLDPATLLPSVAAAIAALDDAPNIVWATGPSKTADVEGILIEGVHGPGVQVIVRCPEIAQAFS